MIKHLIESDNGMKFALDKKQIISLAQALEPYAIAIMMGISDDEVYSFVQQYNNDKARKMHKEIDNKKETTEEQQKSHPVKVSGPKNTRPPKVSGSDIVSLKDYKQRRSKE